jgi:hypothetical protein
MAVNNPEAVTPSLKRNWNTTFKPTISFTHQHVTITDLDPFILSLAAMQKFTNSETSGGQDVLAGHVFIDRISTVCCS